jgi:predicted TIM-barrel fold metal-dependent hydrolase
MQRLSGLLNIRVKLAGLAMHVSGLRFHEAALPPSSEEVANAWRPFVETCIALFGPARCLFESNFPVDKGMVSYGCVWNAFKRLASGYSESEKAALLAGTARDVYRLPREAA